MALIRCSECGSEVSDKAPACPRCGAPTDHAVAAQPVAVPTTAVAPPRSPPPRPVAAQRRSGSPYRPWVVAATLLGSLVVVVGVAVNVGVAILALIVSGAGFYVAMRAKIEMARPDIASLSQMGGAHGAGQPLAQARPRRSLIGAVMALGVLAAIAFWFIFGTLAPCSAMKSQIASIGQSQAGVLGSMAVDVGEFLVRPKLEAMSPVECAAAAFKLKVGGADELQRMVGAAVEGQ